MMILFTELMSQFLRDNSRKTPMPFMMPFFGVSSSAMGSDVEDVHVNSYRAEMKHRSEFLSQPGVISIPAAADGHPRYRLLRILRRCFDLCGPEWYLVLARADLKSVTVAVGESAPAGFLTQQLRRLSKPLAASIPKGAVIGSHSWREMAAVSCYLAWFDSLHMANHGFWRDPATMWSSYIRPYKDVFPYSRFIAAVFDFLRGV
jgi:hypothetical protein